MPVRLVIAGSALLAALASPASAAPFAKAFQNCRGVEDEGTRLACFDALPAPDAEPEFRFSGAGSGQTPFFRVRTRARLVFSSDDAIFVAYLLDRDGAVVQNLHQAGAGDGEFVIDRPGRYRLQVNASGGWRVEMQEL
ncbi:hypothetical protein J7376_07840 [Paracoccus sp. R12_1]|uniref:hypothetical protein n=1 Tax=unclassified Paracoccus (in: a-proteobacteria) TaxID=2688777 RepID=UPI001ADBC072|nr:MULTISPECIES: hypothetical protein [unclassified Paracoccus (in: a-proteobacteria)]MBO9455202.1 hypothetical protein [Paracoccus sp. R12_2]MBO9486426.1 hypothetical protein [Paracoccus sp. R12_1]